MNKVIMVGCDLHEKTLVLKMAEDAGRVQTRRWSNERRWRARMVEDLHRRAAAVEADRIVFAYEASGFGFGLYDELVAAGIECHVLAPTRIERSVKHRRRKTDDRDAERLLSLVRAHVLAGVVLPSVWVPDLQQRDDREVVRMRLGVGEQRAAIKTKIRWLLKRQGLERSDAPAEAWTDEYRGWLERLSAGGLPGGSAAALGSLLRQLEWIEGEVGKLDRQVLTLSRTDRYALPVAAVGSYKGVGVLTAMTFLTELGNLSRFHNRRELGSFIGLTPSSNESGEAADRKGHITHQGPALVRKVLCQAVWARLRSVPRERIAYERLVARNPRHKKIAVVARMRTMAVHLWHAGLAAQQRVRPAAVA